MKLLMLAFLLLPSMANAMGKKPFVEMKAQLAENIKAADEINAGVKNLKGDLNGIKEANIKLAEKFDMQNAAIAGVNNTVSRVSAETKAGRDVINESQLMKDYIQALKDAHTELVGVMWKIIGLLVVQLVGIIGAFGGYMFFTIKTLLYARDKDSEADSAMIKEALKAKEA